MASSDVEEAAKPKPKNDAYTGMLIISLLALLTSCTLLFLDYSKYKPSEPPRVAPPDQLTFPEEKPEVKPGDGKPKAP
jgi:hypothetical protein